MIFLRRRKMKNYYQLFIDNVWLDASDGGKFKTINPNNGEVLADVAKATAADVDKAVKAARKAFDEGPWPKMDPGARARIIRKIADTLMERLEEFATVETLDVGKPIIESKAFDIPMTAGCFEYYANIIVSQVNGESIPGGDGVLDYTIKEPLGVIGAIAPWNFPLAQAIRKVAPAIAAGNTVVLKPSSLAPLTSIMLGELALSAGLPPGVINIIPGLGSGTGEALLAHPNVDKVSFTGSTDVGKNVLQHSAKLIRPSTLELGGKSPGIVLADADIDRAVKGVLFGAFLNQAECCCGLTRVLIDRKIRNTFTSKLVEGTKAIRVGISTDEKTQMGPMVSQAQLDITKAYIQKGIDSGAKLLCGGKAPQNPALKNGFFIEPVIFDDVDTKSVIYREEIFGPVICITAFDTEDELVAAANDTNYGLAASIWTEDFRTAHALARRIKAGTIWFNIHNFLMAPAPYCGWKHSGMGGELGKEGLEMYMKTKNVLAYIDKTPFNWYG
jgi:acyl-CoA reductase-like NAD-dependent aldehyde dehydrogenase